MRIILTSKQTLVQCSLCAVLMLGLLPAAPAADDYKISQLEQAVRTLQRQVQEQSRQIDSLRRQLDQPAVLPPAHPAPVPGATPGGVWLDISRWRQLRNGLSEMEVIAALGPPTSMRTQQGERVLLYAMEIGTAGFLSGSVTLRDRLVVAVQIPMLR